MANGAQHPPAHALALWRGALLVGAALLFGCAAPPPVANPAGSTASSAPSGSADASRAVPPPAPAALLRLEQANDVTLYAISLVGTPYRYGGNTPDSGFDCSGLIDYVYKTRAGLVAPRTVAALSGWGQAVAASDLRSGDLVLFAPGGTTSHAGIYVGDGRFVHAPSTGGEVRLDSLLAGYWSRQPASFRRP